jgi:toluene monooxygenase system protein A
MGIPMPAWESYDEPYKQTYPEYVKIQREKDAGAYSVKAALERSQIFKNADPGWLSVIKAHFGAIARAEYSASTAEARMARFGKAPGMRNMATWACWTKSGMARFNSISRTNTAQKIASSTGGS